MDYQELKQKKTFLSIRWKMLGYLTIIFTFLSAGVFYLIYQVSTELAIEHIYIELIEVARIATEGIDGDLHQALYKNPEYDSTQDWPKGMTDERYWEMAEWLYTVHRINPRALLYTYVSPEPGQVEFVVSMGPLMTPIIGAHFRELYFPQPPSVILDGLARETLSENVVEDKWGSWISGFVPILNSKGQIVAAVGVDYKADIITEIQNRLKGAFFPIFIASYLVILLFVLIISNRLTRPMIFLARTSALIGEGSNAEFEEYAKKSNSFQDELSILGKIIHEMGQRVRSREDELKLMTEQLRHFYQASIEYREDENTALALNIHDEILGQLAVMSLDESILDNPELDKQFQELTNRIRNMMMSLRPVMLDYGLWFVMEEYVEECSNRAGIEAQVELNIPKSEIRFDAKSEEHLFRIGQQACENSLRHANAKSIKIDGKITSEGVNILVEDDGDGLNIDRLDFNSLLANGHFGFASMFERASLIGANLEINSNPGQGTIIFISWEN